MKQLTLWSIGLLSCNLFLGQLGAATIDIHYLGHSSFVLQFDNNVNIVCDYGHPNAWKQWGWDSPIHDIGDLVPDIMTYSHFHADHYDSTRIPEGVKHIISGTDSLNYQGISIRPILTCEEDPEIISNTSYLFSYKDLHILHLGDAQAQIIAIQDSTVARQIRDIIPSLLDLLLMTIEGKTKFIPQAIDFIELIAPKWIIPMHFWSDLYLNKFCDEIKAVEKYSVIKSKSPGFHLSDTGKICQSEIILLKRAPFVPKTD